MNKAECLKDIEAKIKLGMPLTEFERAFWILYGDQNLKIEEVRK